MANAGQPKGYPMKTGDLLNQHSHFAFGKNWLDSATKIDDVRIEQAVSYLRL